MKGVILVMCYFMMHYVDYSMMYHLIRGQSVIKLYIIYNMLEVRRASFSHSGRPPSPVSLARSSKPSRGCGTFLPALGTVCLASAAHGVPRDLVNTHVLI